MNRSKALHDAARICGLDGHVKEIRFKRDCYTHAEQIAETYATRPFGVKNSYLYCDLLDTCFFFDRGGNPCCSFSGVVKYGSADYERMDETVNAVRGMLFAMKKATRYQLHESRRLEGAANHDAYTRTAD